jgi:site-specific DNA-methyltransferase (adenine-specific)
VNRLYFGDNLEWLRDKREFPDVSVDLVYLDPPFNSNADYNVLFREPSGQVSQAQFHAFTDTWSWADAADTYHHFIDNCPNVAVVEMMEAFHTFLKHSPMMAYLAMMAPRLVELNRILKPTGSLYLHCDPTASAYLKMMLDGIFDPVNFRNEIVWRRTNAHNKLSRQYGPIHDTILFYARTKQTKVHPGRRPYLKNYVKDNFPHKDERGFYQSNVLTGSGTRTGESGQRWRHYNPTSKGRHWAIPEKLLNELPEIERTLPVQEILERLDKRQLLLHPRSATSLPRYKQYLESSTGVLYQDIWAYQPGTSGLLEGSEESIDQDVKWLDSEEEKLGYQTQKPVGIIERILETSTNAGDVVLDPFCGCGTTIHAAQKLDRQWIGIDITYLAINLIKRRLKDAFGEEIEFEEKGQPTDFASAKRLAELDKFQFQHWALSLIGARPLKEGEGKGADRGVDGLLYFYETERKDIPGRVMEEPLPKSEPVHREKIIVQVKGGGVNRSDVATLLGDVENQKAAGGVLITLEKPSKQMRTEAADAGRYASKVWHDKDYPRIQILTVEGLLNGSERVDAPPQINPFAMAAREATREKQTEML